MHINALPDIAVERAYSALTDPLAGSRSLLLN